MYRFFLALVLAVLRDPITLVVPFLLGLGAFVPLDCGPVCLVFFAIASLRAAVPLGSTVSLLCVSWQLGLLALIMSLPISTLFLLLLCCTLGLQVSRLPFSSDVPVHNSFVICDAALHLFLEFLSVFSWLQGAVNFFVLFKENRVVFLRLRDGPTSLSFGSGKI